MFQLRCLETIPQPFLFLAAYWVIFFWKFLKNPYLLSTSEIASTFFPHWIWMGRELRQGKFPAQDEIYYKLPGSISFLSTFYPLNLIASYVGSFLSIDNAFKLYSYFILSHYLLGSWFAYLLFSNYSSYVALFGAITLTYSAYCIKPQTPAFVYTVAWIPLVLMGGLRSALGFNMSLLGGYYPILVYLLPIIALKAPYAFFIGCLLAIPQLLPFWGYFKRSVRSGEKIDKNVGRIPFKKLIELVLPIQGYEPTNGVHYPEMAMYMGIAPLFIWNFSWWWVSLLIGLLFALGFISSFQRIPARTLYLISISICFLAVMGFQQFHLNSRQELSSVILMAYLLLCNSSLYPSFPFSQWWDKPSLLYSKPSKANNWPFATGYLEGKKISEYRGAFRLK